MYLFVLFKYEKANNSKTLIKLLICVDVANDQKTGCKRGLNMKTKSI